MLVEKAGQDFQSYFSDFYDIESKNFKNPEEILFKEPVTSKDRFNNNCLGSNRLGNLHCVEVSLVYNYMNSMHFKFTGIVL